MLLSTVLVSLLATLANAETWCAAGGTSPTTTSQPPTTTTTTPPAGGAVVLNFNGNANKCVDIAGANFADGTAVQIYDCNGSAAQKWVIARGSGAVKPSGHTNLCLDAGTNPGNGSKVKIWTCYSGLAQQTWYYTGDNRIALTGQGLCLDLPSGSTTNGNQLQVWSCGTGNNNQVWTSTSTSARRRRDRLGPNAKAEEKRRVAERAAGADL